MSKEIEYLSTEDLLGLAVHLFGDPPPTRDIGLLSSAAARPGTKVFGSESYISIWDKASALLDSVVNNHSLIDGNKRLGWMSCAVFLEINGIDTTNTANNLIYDLVIKVADSKLEVNEISKELESIVLA